MAKGRNFTKMVRYMKGNIKTERKMASVREILLNYILIIGKYILNNQSSYEGNFKDDKMHGKGRFKWSESKIYDGEWKENCLCGYGVFKKSGKLYKGMK